MYNFHLNKNKNQTIFIWNSNGIELLGYIIIIHQLFFKISSKYFTITTIQVLTIIIIH